MSEDTFDTNQFLMMINILSVSTKHLSDEAAKLKIEEVEQKWKELLSTLHSCFSYAQTHNIDLREYKDDLKSIIDSLYVIEKMVRKRKDSKIPLLDDIAQGIIFISDKVDGVLEGIGWKRVVRPITEAIFMIPKKVVEMFSGKTEASKILPDTIQKYLPPPIKALPSVQSNPPVPSKKEDVDIIEEIEWVEVEISEESYARKLLRQMQDRISRIESGEE